MTHERTATRRRVLAAAGTAGAALLAGCGDLRGDSGGDRGSVSSFALPDVGDPADVAPVVVETVPVEIERGKLEDAADRTAALLARLPLPLGPEEIPNGEIRRDLVEAAADASDAVEGARTAGSRFAAMQSLRRARERARYAAAGWAFVEDDLRAEAPRAEREDAAAAARSFSDERTYVGQDPVRAALVHARVEENLARVLDEEGPPSAREASSELLAVAEWGERAESAAARLADARYLQDRLVSSLPDDAGSVRETLAGAADDLAAELRGRAGELPPEPTGSVEKRGQLLLVRLRRDADRSPERVEEAHGPASAVLAGTEGLTDVLAHGRLRERLDSGERIRAESAEDVRERRSAALAAVRSALAESPSPGLARPVLADAALDVSFADRRLAGYDGDVRLARLDDQVERYVTATVRARSVPAATERVLAALGR